MTVEKPKPKQLLRPITTGANSAMDQSQFLAITCSSLEAREKSRVPGAIGFGFDSHWLKNWRESFKPITKLSNRNHVITFDSHLKTALWSSSSFDRVTRFLLVLFNGLPFHYDVSLFLSENTLFFSMWKVSFAESHLCRKFCVDPFSGAKGEG